MATVTVDPTPPATTGSADWDRIIGPADAWVREALGEYVEGKEVSWEVEPGRYGQPPTCRLMIAADGLTATEDFTPEDVTDRWEVRWKARRAWGRLNDQQLAESSRVIHLLLAELREEAERAE